MVVLACLLFAACTAGQEVKTAPSAAPPVDVTTTSEESAITDSVTGYLAGLIAGDSDKVLRFTEQSVDLAEARAAAFGGSEARVGAASRVTSVRTDIACGTHPLSWSATATVSPVDAGQGIVVHLEGYAGYGGVKVTAASPDAGAR